MQNLCIATLLSLTLITTSCSFSTTPISNHRVEKPQPVHEQFQQGIASWYGPGFHGRKTANGERFNQNALTAAHRHLPIGTKVLVTNVSNGKSVEVRINDRGPYIKGRVIDLSKAAAERVGMIQPGTASIQIRIISKPT